MIDWLVILIFFVVNFIFFVKIDFINRIINIYDKPNKIKVHKKKISLAGGSIIFFNLFIFLILNKINFLNFLNSNVQLISFIILIVGFYLIGLYDDKYNLSPITRILIMTLILLIILNLNDFLLIKKLFFFNSNKIFFLGNLSILFTILCVLIFTYSLNMFDGINLQSITYAIFIFLIFVFKSKFPLLSLIIIICLFFLFILNYRNKIFLGDSGIYVLAGIISYIIIYEYNSDNKFFSIENIFLIMMLPGFDFIRLFIQRTLKGKHPFLGDKKHLHHLLAKKFKLFNVYLIICFLYIFPFFLNILGINSYLIIVCFLLLYLFINFHFLKKFQ